MDKLGPKDDGIDLMISALQSQAFGFGLELIQEKINQVNEYLIGKNTKMKKAGIKKWKVHSRSHSL
jgi:hypothetical protein